MNSPKKNPLQGITCEKAYEAYLASVESSDSHLKVAKTIAAQRHYGIAISHLILSTEELVKGLLFYFQGLGIEIDKVNDIHLFFSDHIIRHQAAIMIDVTDNMMRPIMGIIIKMHDKMHKTGLEPEYTELEQALISKDEKKLKVLFENLSEMFDWWYEANNMKNSGLYVDIKDQKILTPMKIRKREFEQAETITGRLRDVFKFIINYFEKLSPIEKSEFIKMAIEQKLAREYLNPIINGRLAQRKNHRSPTSN